MLKHTRLVTASLSLGAIAALSACGGGAAESDESANWRSATSVEEGGGMDALVEAAQSESTLNVMGLYEDWANYGGLLDAFSQTYGIEIENDTSTGASQDLVNAVKNRQGQETSLDYLDTGASFAVSADAEGLLAEYRPASVDDLPDQMQSETGTWFNHLGGTMAIGCDAAAVDTCPESFEDLLDEQYRGQIAMPGDPTTGESSFMTVFAASLANGGTLDDISPGVDYFAELSESGNLIPSEAVAGTVETGETPIVINWDYLLLQWADDLADGGVDLQTTIPADGTVSSYYAASVNDDAPHPAVARLWQEFVFSDEGQNLLLEGYVKPGRLDAMIDAGTVDEEALAALPETPADVPLPSQEQRESQQAVVADTWAQSVG
ncbi:extracellular solute-binding protein [Brevibacterium jeotgali]|uniref:Putative spermidine/putrescine transport system substrate-binding protein n=1 Tax=Brevibacterium jeotgali TaxID=1262550 RepID=A0A2H1L3R4_9MICO|nr:extracellular solute-binding protein [Brevibacterium jeotgali]TWC01793.1 putative spermidine/putrescine transport system substrate-binding protein [Brevibacterium jeotgali]SMY11538.1 putative spermidine/putrescine transport system substrate-binding protein [Brevibacterium jeotgali]